MTPSENHFNAIATEALSLTTRERGDLAAKLIRSLDQDHGDDDTINLKIVKDRLKKYEAGESDSRAADEVIKELREKYGL